MPRRLAAALAVLALGLVIHPTRADAHPIDRFTACAATSPTTPTCARRGAHYTAGDTVYLRGRVTPAHTGFGQVWRRAPWSNQWIKFGTIGIDRLGRIRWSWLTYPDDVYGGRAYTFQFRIPGHGRSWTTKAWLKPAA
jgi:hypothetical protein